MTRCGTSRRQLGKRFMPIFVLLVVVVGVCRRISMGSNGLQSKYTQIQTSNQDAKLNKTSSTLVDKAIVNESIDIDRKLKEPTGKQAKTRYLAPIHTYFDGGPNWAMTTFRMELKLALLQNRTIVATPVRVHDRFQMDILHTMKFPNDTIDVDKMSKIVPVASIEEFYKDCKDELKPDIKMKPFGLLMNKNISNNERFHEIRQIVYNQIKPNYPVEYAVKENSSSNANKHFIEETQNVRCLVFYFDEDMRWFKSWNDNELNSQINEHFAWAPYIREMVDGVQKKICDGHQFAALHWRNSSGEGCIPGSKWEAVVCKAEKKMNLAILSQITELMVESLVHFLKQEKLTCIYLAYPPYEQEFVVKLKAAFPRIFSLSDVLKMSAEISRYSDDNYILSIVEQEIAVRSAIFIGWKGSSWTRMVDVIRSGLNRTSMPMPKVPNMPRVLQKIS